MTDPCERLHDYVDGELDPAEERDFEAHLASCDACAAELPRLLALLAALDTVAESASRGPAGGHRLTVIPGGLTGAPRELAMVRPPGRRRPWWIVGLGGVAAAAAALLLILRPPTLPTDAPVAVSLQGDLGPSRSLEARLSYPGAERYRPLDVARGARAGDAIPLDRMIGLERAKNWHGLAVASLLAGERDRAARSFAQAPATPAVDSDRAALELVDGSQQALERALEDVDRALAAAPGDGAARWNRALVLRGLGLPLAAARELDRVAALGEPGWTDEARTRAASLRAEVGQRRTRWQQASAAGVRLVADRTPVPSELTSVTGYMTLTLYDAVRSATSSSEALALVPMAQALDGVYRADRLTAYVRRVAASNFAVRKPLAEAYRQLFLGQPVPGGTDGFLRRLEQAGADDIRMGALVRAGQVRGHLDDYRRLAAATGDPWFAVIAEHEAARAEIARGETGPAQHRLRDALALARRERLAYRALLIETELVSLHRNLRELSEAYDEARAAYREAAATGEALIEMNTLGELAAINLDRYAHGLARAYLAELLERSESSPATGPSPFDDAHDCAERQYVYGSLANVSVLEFDPDRAREEIAKAPSCTIDPATQNALTLRAALVRTELYRFSHRADDRDQASKALDTLRHAQLPESVQALLSFIEGDLTIDSDRAAGQRALREAIALAARREEAAHEDSAFPVLARAYSYSLLALDAGRASEFAGVIRVLAETLGVPPPERCAVAIAVQGLSSVVAFSDAHGEVGGQYVAARKSHALDVSTLVPPDIAARLSACERVAVLARAPVLGAGRLLPPALAWTYLLKGPPSTPAAPPAPATAGRRLVVANPDTPPELNLPPLGPYPDEPGAADLQLLRGADATPSRVLLAMRDAQVIELHTHGFIANDISEASHLVLSPELDHQYAMTAADVARVKLTAAPLVILGACHAATSSRSLEGGMGLAEAFLRSGARGVIASPDAVPDRSGHAFFAAVRQRVMQGADPAIAVRDERMHRLSLSHDDTWVSGVVVFE
ncbi:MAG TPA: CHAT domain-containing protein [Kofleriaceae bacterium]|nr:CHAT domain-containing protein [Kofleriaceae bacterium]